MAHDHSNHAHKPKADVFNELDPHGFEGHGNSHAVVGPMTLRVILAILLVFTALTVGLAQAEVAIQNYLQIQLPGWINIAIAMSIATVKVLLVMAYFMQLRFDNPLNSIIMAFTVFTLALFLGFTSLDLFSRGMIYSYKSGQVIAGGTGNQVNNANKPMVIYARERHLAQLVNDHGPVEGQRIFDAQKAAFSHGHGHKHDDTTSTSKRSRIRNGTTDALSTTPADNHNGTHGGSETHSAPAGAH